MNNTDHAEYTQPCIECGALFVLRDSGRPPKFCSDACRKKHHRKLNGTKSGTKAPPALVELRRAWALFEAFEELPEHARQFFLEKVKTYLDRIESQTMEITIGSVMADCQKLSDADFLLVKNWINQAVVEES
jgi:hypothetical protein